MNKKLFFTATLMFLTFTFTSCSGYRIHYSKNPLKKYEIETVSVPMFLNRSSIPKVSGPFTREITLMLEQFSDLRVYPGDWKQTDAVLIGIITSVASTRKALAPSNVLLFPSNRAIGSRRAMYLPTQSTLSLALELILIKNPTHHDIELVLSSLGTYVYNHPKIILRQTIPIAHTFDRFLLDGLSPDEGRVVNMTKNKGLITKRVDEMAKQAASTFRELFLNVF